MVGYVTALLTSVRYMHPVREASSFCDLLEMTFCDFIAFFSFLTQATLYFVPCAVFFQRSLLGTITGSLTSHGEIGWCDELMFWNGFFEFGV